MKEDKILIAEVIGFGVLIAISTYDFVRNIITRRRTSKRLAVIENKLNITQEPKKKAEEAKEPEATEEKAAA